MTKKEILKMTGLTESDFYKKYPTQESFMMEYGGKIAGYEAGGKISYSAKDAAAGKDIGKPGKNFSKIAAEAGERYGSKEAGQRVAGAILAKLRGKREKGGSITPTPTGDIFDMMGMSYLNSFANGGPTDGGYLGMRFTDRGLSPSHMMELGTTNPAGFDRGLQDVEFSNAASRSAGIYGGFPLNRDNTLYGTGALGMNEVITRGVDESYKSPAGVFGGQGYKMTDWKQTTSPYAEAGLSYRPTATFNNNYKKGFTSAGSDIGVGVSYDNNKLSPYVDFNPELGYNFGNKLIGKKSKKNQPFTVYGGMDLRARPFRTEDLYETGAGMIGRNPGVNERATGAERVNFYTGLEGRTRDGLGVYGNVAFDKGLRKTFDGNPMFTVGVRKTFADGGDIDVKAPLYDETELNPSMNPDVYNMGGYYAMGGLLDGGLMNAYGMGGYSSNMASARALVNKMGGYYNMGGSVPTYAFGDVVKKIGAGAYGVGEGLLDTVTMGTTDQLTDMGYEGLQGLGGSKGKDNRTEDMIRGFGTTAGAVTGAVINPAATGTAIQQGTKGLGQGISLAAPDSQAAQAIGQFLPMVGSIAGSLTGPPAAGSAGAAKSADFAKSGFGQFTADASKVGQRFNQMGNTASNPFGTIFGMFGQNAMGATMKNGGMTPGYMQNIRKFAQGGMTVGNVESNELLIDPAQYGAGGVPKVLADYTNLPAHPKDGSIDDRGTVPLPENKFIVTKPMAKIYKIAEQSNDGLLSSAVTNKVAFDKNKKEQEEMQKASNAYGKFMAKYGGTIEKMYGCGGKTYGCGGMTKYADGSMTLPTMGSSLPQGWGLSSQFNSGMSTALPSGWNASLNEPSLSDVQMGSSLPQGWNLQPSTGVDGWQLNSSSLNPFARTEMTPMNPIGPSEINNPVQMSLAANPYADKKMVSRQDLSDYDQNLYNFKPSTLGQIAPMIPSVALGLEAALSKPYNINASKYMVNERLTPQKTVPNYRPIRESEMRTAYDLSQMAPGSGGYLAARTALGSNAMRTKQDYLKSLQDEYNKQKLGADQFNITKDIQNKQTALAIEQFNEQNRAARRNAMREQFGKNLPAAFFNQQYNNMGMQAIQAQYPNQPFNWGIFGKSEPNLG